MIARILAIILGMMPLTSCANRIYELSPTVNDPANPNAPEAPFSPPLNRFQGEISVKTNQQITEPAPQTTSEIFTCPMHPEIVQSEQDVCPKCGMRLIPKDQKESDPKEKQ
ncbi:MAG: hypothetical protein DWB56_16785 [Candidatus Jettenia sp.]|uniref:Heavy metal binding domain-containing protein n=1 Tax=Candidatus Jettenia caeni TaxID=247490 RepID=I3IK91_9BACT|nr:heavy metal-binding domain-containing protein [Candidatus Jettenia sp. AMX1]MBC6930574.1 hypothetical protein [Candidatus Jettenia sp.]NUN23275.1 hypothetical protein [Candidatus Jettenia caeni]KAA0246872.1 MAG: hypothetical protein EDM77_16210 [Candidatus Jettenia sp. AMX1]MCE7882201.1 hypothetical protein [Candidatus Jettenia sp. AMX1]MCQ3928710.1 hypothetical protein [Candidatus Jettenia sp.]